MSKQRKPWGNNFGMPQLQVSDALYPEMKVPGLEAGEMPKFSINEYPSAMQKEIE
jgi:hypothetical protein